MNVKIVLVVLSYTMLATSLGFVWLQRHRSPDSDLFWQEETRLEVQEIVEDRYLEPVDEEVAEDLFDGAMRGYVGALDPFSRYFSGAERVQLDEDTRGEFGGIGVQVRAVAAGVLVTAVRIDGPADRAGLAPGELIAGVDGVPLEGLDLDEMIGRVKGPPGTEVELLVETAEGVARVVTVERAMVELDSVPIVRVLPGAPPVGYLRVSGFSETTGAAVGRALAELAGAEVEGLVLDLRFNVGGVVSGAVDVASHFLPPDAVVCHTRGRTDGVERGASYVTSTPEEGAEDGVAGLPLVVLVNEESASASEILAGALQDHGRAVLVGDLTYGKFLVQTLYPLATRDALVRITTSRYETPLGRSSQRNPARGRRGGMLPDVRVPLTDDETRSALADAFRNEQDERLWRVLPERAGRDPWIDPQLAVALDLLHGASRPVEPVLHARTP